jgi:hypothetical protein
MIHNKDYRCWAEEYSKAPEYCKTSQKRDKLVNGEKQA